MESLQQTFTVAPRYILGPNGAQIQIECKLKPIFLFYWVDRRGIVVRTQNRFTKDWW